MVASNDLALVLSGGGARGAYQIGFLHALGRHYPDLVLPIITGVSAGAINAAYLANSRTSFADKTQALVDMWSQLTTEQVFHVSKFSLARNLAGWFTDSLQTGRGDPYHAHSLVDATPLCHMLQRFLGPVNRELPGIAHNLASGALKAVAVTASSYSTGQSVTWVQGCHNLWSGRSNRKTVRCRLKLDHILASASLPLFFPAVRIHRRWFGDGGIRMTAPLAPAVYLGASRILAIHTRSLPGREDMTSRKIDTCPSPAQIAGTLFDAIFLDVFDNDVSRLQRINRVITRLPETERNGLRPIQLKLIRPSVDLGKLAGEYVHMLPKALRFLTRGASKEDTRPNDALSLILFQPDYLRAVIELGFRDAEANIEQLGPFLHAQPDADEGALRLGLTHVV